MSDDRGLAEALEPFGIDAVDLDMLRRGDKLDKAGAKFYAAIERLLAERDEARETSRRLNRESQLVGREAYRAAKQYIRSLYERITKRRLNTLWNARRALQARYPEDAGILVDALAERMTARARAAEAQRDKLKAALASIIGADGVTEGLLFGEFSDEQPCSFTVQLGILRRARQALQDSK